MSPNPSGPRLVALFAALALLAFGAFRIVHHALYLAPNQEGLALGMAWLQREYQLDDATFAKITEAHQKYFRDCAQRCHELNDVNHHFLSVVSNPNGPSDPAAVKILRENICQDCEQAMLLHIHEVAALMKPDTARHFIADVKRAIDPKPSRGRSRTP